MRFGLSQVCAVAGTFFLGILSGSMAGTGLAAFTAKGLPQSAWVMQ